MTTRTSRFLTFPLCLFAAQGLSAQYAEGFDSQASADITTQAQSDTGITFVDYANMTIGGSNFSVPEAPRQIAGSAATRGVLLQANIGAGAAAAVNIIAGQTPIAFGGRYRVSFDAWLNVPLPPPNGSTEQLLWGVGTDGAGVVESRNTRNQGAMGVWGWLAGENGYGTEDAAIFLDGVELADLGDTQTGEAGPFNAAFDSPYAGGPNNAPANQWVRVDIEVDAGGVRVLYNDVEFFNEAGLAPNGFAMLGYEDPFSSVSSDPDGIWGLFDNFRVTQIHSETGDAGDLPATAQVPSGVGPLLEIEGECILNANDADMYKIVISDPASFSATTEPNSVGSLADTQLFLFDSNGNGIAMNDDTSGAPGNRSTLTDQFVLSPGTYYLAVAPWDTDPTSAGDEIWADNPFDAERAPDGPGAAGVIDGWDPGTQNGAGTYRIVLTGCEYPDASECFLIVGTETLNVSLGSVLPLYATASDVLLVDPIFLDIMSLSNLPSIVVPSTAPLGVSFYTQGLVMNPFAFPNDPIKLSQAIEWQVGASTTAFGTASGMQLWATGPAAVLPGQTVTMSFAIQ